MRVRDIAKQLGVPPAEVLQVLEDMGEYVKSHASYVEAPVIRRLHERFGVTYGVADRPTHSASITGRGAPTEGLAPPPRRTKRDNHPLMGEISPRRVLDSSLDSRSARSAPPTTSWSARTVEQRWADLAGGDASHALEFEEWKFRGFSDVERDVWMASGLRAGQARWAAELRDGGLSPTDLEVELHGWKVVDRLQRGEGAKAVARMLIQLRNSAAS
jgi:hypothetical protein